MEELIRLLGQEHQLHLALLENEGRKSKAILQAQGRELELLSHKTDELLRESQKLEQKRRRLSPLAFQVIMAGAPASSVKSDLEKNYRITIERLQAVLAENQAMLHQTRQSIHRLLGGLATARQEIYTDGRDRNSARGGLLLNATG